jgi:hypothetical protein
MNEDRGDDSVTEADDNPLVRGAALTGLLAAGALYYLYRRSRHEGGSPVVESVPAAAAHGGQLVQRGQQLLENTLDHLSEQAMSEVKVILKNGLHRLEQIVDDL